ncbi:hypothetical protein L2E82_05746 [Cichorium intybus]|uniref:Uncharacterized protein n=1 Tax=Cichorium intybus TaxID=13427 RepID=A0ACB9H8K9_CICIN|nr:hypothetical protein L2E82_05746 [Cichorium intybus]
MVKIELEAAEAVAGLAHFPANMSKSRGNDSVAERVKDECINVNSLFDTFPKCSINLYEDPQSEIEDIDRAIAISLAEEEGRGRHVIMKEGAGSGGTV